jgi:hypothetical protein
MQRHALEPVMFSLTILNRETQQHETAWRHLGFIPDLEKIAGYDNSTTLDLYNRGHSTQNYHKCMDVILGPLAELQKERMTVHLQMEIMLKKFVNISQLQFLQAMAKVQIL